MMPRRAKRPPVPAFGSLAAIAPARFMRLHVAMQGEGVRLMLEHGAAVPEIAAKFGLSDDQVARIAAYDKPFQRGGEVIKGEPASI